MMLKTIKGKILVWNGLVLIFTLLIIELLVYFSLKNHLYNSVDNLLIEECKEIGTSVKSVESVLYISDDHEWNEAEHTELGDQAIFVQLSTPQGRVMRQSKNLLTLKEPIQFLSPDTIHNVLITNLAIKDEIMRRVDYAIYQKKQRIAILMVAQSVSTIETFLDTVEEAFFVITPLFLLIALAGTRTISGKTLEPIERITSIAQSIIHSGDLSRRIEENGLDKEVADLANTLNTLYAQLDSSMTRIKNFSADASHELRTPLTIIRGQIEVLLSRTRSTEEYRQSAVSVHEEVLKMTNIINNLLQLARVDAGKFDLEMDVLSMDTLINNYLPVLQKLCTKENLKLQAYIENGVEVIGNHDALNELLINLSENAIKYNITNGWVKIGLFRRNGSVELEISDGGIGIASEEQEKIFDRFYRVDKTRSRQMGGSGLGLAICKWIVTEHHSILQVQSEPAKGSTFKVVFPGVEYE